MQESLLHYVWRHQRFNKQALKTTDGLSINIIHPGFLNKDAGPDFSQAKVMIDGIEWNGSIEIHIKASQWKQHQHHLDHGYDNVILHVVWQADKEAFRADDTSMFVLALSDRVDPELLARYERLMNNEVETVPCEAHFPSVKRITKYTMLDSLAMERLETKSKKVNQLLAENDNDWEEVTYQLLMQVAGLKVNSEVFKLLSESLPFKIIKKHHASVMQLESLLFGMSGFLEESNDAYQEKLANEYQFLKQKYHLTRRIEPVQWKFMRLRPAGFPTVRLAQLAALFFGHQSLFSLMMDITSMDDVTSSFKQPPSDYWKKHYTFSKPSNNNNAGFGAATIALIIINVAVPLLVAYGKYTDDQSFIDKAVRLLEQVKGENNRITRIYQQMNLKAKSALDSQAMIQWYNTYCQQKKCLACAVGNEIIGAR